VNCCQCQGIEEVFNQDYVTKELKRYRLKGPAKTTRMLVEEIKKISLDGSSLLDIGGGIGAIQHELLGAGVQEAVDVEASSAYLAAARIEAQRRGLAERIHFHFGNFVDLAANIAPADIVTLDRVICCYDDMEKLVSLSVARARKLYAVVYPRSTWLTKLGLAIENTYLRFQRSPYRSYVHPTKAVEAIVTRSGFKRRAYRQTLLWQVVVYAR
jgi:magnesium-protoporphyrin O-methyltransferase